MALELIWREEEDMVEQASVYVDSQAVLKALQTNKPVSGHQIADEIYRVHERVMVKHLQAEITFRWITVHKDCIGNEKVDEQAKLASSGTQDSLNEELLEMP